MCVPCWGLSHMTYMGHAFLLAQRNGCTPRGCLDYVLVLLVWSKPLHWPYIEEIYHTE